MRRIILSDDVRAERENGRTGLIGRLRAQKAPAKVGNSTAFREALPAQAPQSGTPIDLTRWATQADAAGQGTTNQMVSNSMWTAEMLTGDLSPDLLQRMKDPAGFMNARKALLLRSTDAVHRSMYDGAESPVNPSDLSTKSQADAMQARLVALGMRSDVKAGLPQVSQIDYRTDERRHYAIGGLNVGRLAERYAMYPKEAADEMTRQELRYAGILSS